MPDATKHRSAGLRRVRSLVRAGFLLTAAALLFPKGHQWDAAVAVTAASPFVAIASLICTRAVTWITGIGIFVAVVSLVRRRWFCRWVCPAGLLTDSTSRLGRRLGRSYPSRLPLIGQWLALMTFGGALIGYPVFLWLDPLALFSSAFNSFRAAVEISLGGLAISLAGLAVLCIMSAVWPGVWCHKLCPLGGTQDLLAGVSRVTQQAVQQDDRPTSDVVNPGMSRRFVLGSLIGIGAGWFAAKLLDKVRSCIRPPGAIPEDEFVGLCIRCGNCTRACPAKIIQPNVNPDQLTGLLAPVIQFREDYCHEDCTACADVCPSGALRRFPIQHKSTTRIGVASVDMDLCLLAEDRECAACRNNCPFEAIAYVWSDEEYMLMPTIDQTRCPGCGACVVACPTEPKKAIIVEPV